jgi:uncharacterized protein YmfQ (DUF2313 family)
MAFVPTADNTEVSTDSTLYTADMEWPVSDPISSGWFPHGANDYAAAFLDLLPFGAVWPRDPESVQSRFFSGLAKIWGENVDPRAADLLTRESDPRQTIELLPDWERNWGLPDPCVAEPLTIGDRQRALVAKMTMIGGQSRQFFIRLAATIGYNIDIIEYAPYMAGVSRAGDTRATGAAGEPFRWQAGAPEMRFYWSIKVDTVRLTWFRAGWGGGQAGVDPHLRIGIATDLECLLNRVKPAHTQIVFDYSGLGPMDPMAGTP